MKNPPSTSDTPERCLMTSEQSARYLCFAPSTLKLSRHTGQLAGVPAPVYIKVGRKCFYDRKSLDSWLDQFSEIRSTAHVIEEVK